MPKLPAKAALIAVAVALGGGGCSSAPLATAGPTTVFVIPTQLPNGRVEITIATSYARGAVATIPVAIVATRGTIVGPIAARVLASGIGTPAEVLVRELAVAPITVVAAARGSTTLSWDTRDANGVIVPADAYSLVLEIRTEDGGPPRTVAATVTLELR
ncbi:MAG: hypothetical protein ACYC9W_06995 [Candidatus Limnocylindria bacterium]